MKLVSWNVNGLRAVLKKGALLALLEAENPDILCLQEIKSRPEQVAFDVETQIWMQKNGMKYLNWNPAKRAGYSGTAIFAKVPETRRVELPFSSRDDYGELADEGRVLTLEYPEFFLVDCYTPNSKPDLSRLSLRHESWDPEFFGAMRKLENEKPVIFCGDFNAAHKEIDIARPRENEHSAGFTKEEREGVDRITEFFIDSFRKVHPTEVKYSWWSMRGGARERNVGWRIDYFFVSPKIKIVDADIREKFLGSDHAPIILEI
ncbi:exodeoxyribonuclease III [Candidatus Saccharibacteria bacterium]|nr:exodeoxyribonuclease III [Candidatus Saccharibacteria bacterium]